MEADKLLIVAHPDDEILWGGANLFAQPGWFVLCATNANNKIRASEFYRTMSYSNVTQFLMLDTPDKYTEDEDESDKIFNGTQFEKIIHKLSKKHWKLVLTHNSQGEYGHEHHRSVHKLVKRFFPHAKFFTSGEKLPASQIEGKRENLIYYRETQDIAKKFFNRQINLKVVEKQHFFNETLFVTPHSDIPKLIHQIWFGNTLDSDSVRAHLIRNVEKNAKKNGYKYKLWTNTDFKEDNFPLTWKYMKIALDAGNEIGQSRYAQVADLARYELLHRFGGVYLDSLFEVSDEFFSFISSHKTHTLIVSNEDPCGLECHGTYNRKYLSNGFFACKPGCISLKRLLHPETLKYIDFDNEKINQETGPYFFRLGIKKGDNVLVIPTEKIYPFMVNDSEYRQGEENKCLVDKKLLHNCLHKKYKNSFAVYHSGFGGSWSW